MKRRTGVRTRSAVAACAALGLALASASETFAVTIAVTTQADDVAADGACSLREAVSSANDDSAPFSGAGECAAGSGADTVAVPAGVFSLSRPGAGEDANSTGDLDILGTELTIAGAGASATTIDLNGFDRAIDVRVGRIATVRNLTITGGEAPNGSNGSNATGGGLGDLSVTGGDGNPGEPGGAIRNLGTLTVEDSTLEKNSAGKGGNGGTGTGGNAGAFPGSGAGGDGGEGGAGGGIFNAGVLSVVRCVLRQNTAGAGGAGGFGQGGSATGSNGMGGLASGGSGGDGGGGGGVAAGSGATTTLQDSSITANTAGAGGDGGLGQGGNGGPAGPMSSATAGTGGLTNGGPGGDGGGGGGARTVGSLAVAGVLLEGNAGGAGGDGGNANGGVGGPALGTGNGGQGGIGRGSVGGDGGPGGGAQAGSLSLTSSTVSGNTAGPGGPGGNGTGGNGGGAISGTGGNGGGGDGGDGGDAASGGGLRTEGASTIRHATITSNQLAAAGGPGTGTGGSGSGAGSGGFPSQGSAGAAGAGGAVSMGTGAIPGSATTVANTIVAGNTAPSCTGTVTDGQHNIVLPDTACPGANVDPLLGPLTDNGGPTRTQKVGPGSPAFDTVQAAACSQTDQRGVSRPQGGGCEAGAYEFAPPSVTTGQAVPTSSTTATLQGAVTPNARATSYRFELGTTTAYGRSAPEQSAGASTAAQAVAAAVDGLAAGVTYHYRLVASNADGTSAGEDRTLVIPDTDVPDTDVPRFLSASLAPKVFAVNRRGRAETPVASQKRRRGTTFRYVLSEPARVVFAISRARPGRRVGRRCVKPTRRNRARRKCTRYVLVRRFAVPAGATSNRKKFSGKIGRRSLRPGRYQATLIATDAAGNASAPKRLRFRVVRR